MRDVVAGVHQLLDPHQTLAQLAAGVKVCEVLGAEPFLDQERHRQRVAERQSGRGAGRRHEVERARLLGDVTVERDVGKLAQGRVWMPRERDDSRAAPPDGLEQAKNLVCLAAVGQRDDNVAGLNHAKVAVNRFGGMQEERGRPGAGQRRGNLPRDDARLAHAGDDDAARQSRSRSTARTKRASRRSTSARMAAASVCKTLRASERSGMTAPVGQSGRSGDGIDSLEFPQQWGQQVESQRILRVALGARRVLVDFEEHAVDAGRNAGPGQRVDVLGRPPVTPSPAPGNCRLCVTSKTTGTPSARIIGKARMSTTRLL